MSPEQLVLALDLPDANDMSKMTVVSAGLAREAAPGPERLLRELVKRGLSREYLHTAAALALALEEEASASR